MLLICGTLRFWKYIVEYHTIPTLGQFPLYVAYEFYSNVAYLFVSYIEH
jgi:hypothetical protein